MVSSWTACNSSQFYDSLGNTCETGIFIIIIYLFIFILYFYHCINASVTRYYQACFNELKTIYMY